MGENFMGGKMWAELALTELYSEILGGKALLRGGKCPPSPTLNEALHKMFISYLFECKGKSL